MGFYYLNLNILLYSPHLEERLLVSNARRASGTFALLFVSVCNMVPKCLFHHHNPHKHQLD